jgi:hypothetical protein
MMFGFDGAVATVVDSESVRLMSKKSSSRTANAAGAVGAATGTFSLLTSFICVELSDALKLEGVSTGFDLPRNRGKPTTSTPTNTMTLARFSHCRLRGILIRNDLDGTEAELCASFSEAIAAVEEDATVSAITGSPCSVFESISNLPAGAVSA